MRTALYFLFFLFLACMTHATVEEILKPDRALFSADSNQLLGDSKISRIQCSVSMVRGRLHSLMVYYQGDWLSVSDSEIIALGLPDLNSTRLSVLRFEDDYHLIVTVSGMFEVSKAIDGLVPASVSFCFLRRGHAYTKVKVAGNETYYSIVGETAKHDSMKHILRVLKSSQPNAD